MADKEDKVEKTEKVAETKEPKKPKKDLSKEIAKGEDMILGDLNDKNVINTVVGTTIGFFVWFMWSKFIGTDPANMSNRGVIEIKEKIVIEKPECKYDCYSSESDTVAISTKDYGVQSFW